VPLLLGWTAVALQDPCAYGQQAAASGSSSWSDTITAPFKWGADKVGSAFSSKPAPAAIPEDDVLSLKSKAKPGAELYVALARVYEQSGRMVEAEQQYQTALKEKPDDLGALLGYAHLKDSTGKSAEAIQLYERAAKVYPQQASVYNNLGLCLARQSRYDEAVSAVGRAVQLEPKNPLYRNNMAAALIDQNRAQEAFLQLRQVYGDAAAHYNLGYLLNKKGQTQAAMQHFGMALTADPSMDAARRWLERLQRQTMQDQPSPESMMVGTKAANRWTAQRGEVVISSDEPSPHRLPPTAVRQPESGVVALPDIHAESSSAPAAPLPPPASNSAMRPLPRVE
jgi:tetratricopeptide (TPR) repeat protein